MKTIHRLNIGDDEVGYLELKLQPPSRYPIKHPDNIKEKTQQTQRAVMVAMLQLSDWLNTHEYPFFCKTALGILIQCLIATTETYDCPTCTKRRTHEH